VSVVVVAGTGSVVAGRDASGRVVTTGGLGHVVGDEGSAFRLGRALIVRYLDGDADAGQLGPAIDGVLGTERGGIVRALDESDERAAALGRVAPVLTASADAGTRWARDLVAGEMEPLAELTARHLARFEAPGNPSTPIVGLVGGVWRSGSVREAFADALSARLGIVTLAVPERSPVEAAVRLGWYGP
jgi:N-acetylglucosamine kinase-like BadF-type ATPase